MILQALTAYYEQLLRQGKIAAPGWDGHFKASYELRLNDAGQLVDVVDLRVSETKGKKTVIVPRELRVPEHKKRTSGVFAYFLCDKASYIFGMDETGCTVRTRQCFDACSALHHSILRGIDTPAAKAILRYFDHWNPSASSMHPLLAPIWKELTGNVNLVLSYESSNHTHLFTTEETAIQSAWETYYFSSQNDSPAACCLITGKHSPIALVHSNIKGVPGTKSTGGALVSFKNPSTHSYGHKQGENAPVSEYAAFAYTTALNLLIADRNHCKRVGDTTIVCWAESAEPAYQDAFSLFLFGAEEASGIEETDVQAALRRLAAGQTVPFLEKELAPDQHFYVLGLAPNAARLSVRFFLRDTFGTFARNLQKHADALEITRPAYDNRKTLSVWALAMETVNRKERSPSPAPQLAGDLLRAVLTGGRYPATLLNGVTMRIRAEQDVTRGRAAILKAYYLRNSPTDLNKEVFTVSLNETTNVPYILGRLFSVLEAVQSDANPGINTTIKDRYFNSACATPALVFPTLLKLAQKHLQKLPDGKAVFYNKQITELASLVPESGFPARLSLPDQGKFEIGYYHQTQKRFEKKNKEE